MEAHSARLPLSVDTDPWLAGNDSGGYERGFHASPTGYIYDYDAPGLLASVPDGSGFPKGYARSSRNHFLSFAALVVMDAQGRETGVLCSEFAGWIVSLAIQKIDDGDENWRLVPWFTWGNGAWNENEQPSRALEDEDFGVPTARPEV